MKIAEMLELIAEIKRRNDELQSKFQVGRLEWHSHESIDDCLFDLTAALETMSDEL